MKSMIACATFLLFGAGAAAVGAADLRGSDTLEEMTKEMLTLCAGTTGLVYIGGGSTAGEQAISGSGSAPLNVISQSVAPMSRSLRGGPKSATDNAANGVCAVPASQSTAENLFVALDGLSMVGNSTAGAGCALAYSPSAVKSITVTDQNGTAGLDCPGCTGDQYAIATNDWRDVLKVVYAGVHHNGAVDCASDVRFSIANNYGNLFDAACGNGSCTQIRHAWRRADLSGTTDSFLALLGLRSASTNPFCNGVGGPFTRAGDSDFLDKDPIRRTCEGNGNTTGEQVCNRDSRLGLVTTVFVPETFGTLTQADVFPTLQCSPGRFAWKDTPSGVLCADGTSPVVGTCLIPYNETAGVRNFACINRRSNPNVFTPSGMDSRVYNLHLRRANGTLARDVNRRYLVGSFYRIHTTSVNTNGTAGGCRTASSTDQIGCLVGASPCSIGYAGREADSQPGAQAFNVRGLAPTVANIQNLVLTASTADDYPLSRKLYFNTIVGFENLPAGPERQLATCFANPTLAAQAANAAGFVEVPGGPKCEDFNEAAPYDLSSFGCAAATNVNACANNPAPFPTN